MEGKYVRFVLDDFIHITKASRTNADEISSSIKSLNNSVVKVIFFTF